MLSTINTSNEKYRKDFWLRQEIKMFMIEKGKTFLELKVDDWLWNLTFLTNVIIHLNVLNLKSQGPGMLICYVYTWLKHLSQYCYKLFVNLTRRSNSNYFENCH